MKESRKSLEKIPNNISNKIGEVRFSIGNKRTEAKEQEETLKEQNDLKISQIAEASGYKVGASVKFANKTLSFYGNGGILINELNKNNLVITGVNCIFDSTYPDKNTQIPFTYVDFVIGIKVGKDVKSLNRRDEKPLLATVSFDINGNVLNNVPLYLEDGTEYWKTACDLVLA